MIKKRIKGDLIVLSGPSGCGKDTIIKGVLKRRTNIKKSISMTTRNKRKGEKEGIHYYFVSKSEFEENIKKDNFLEYAVVHTDNYYGTPKGKIFELLNKGTDIVLIIDIQGALKIKETYPEAIFIFILPPSMRELKTRLISRGSETKETLYKRFKSMYKEINEISKYNYVVVNDDIKDATNKVISILDSEKCRVDRIEEIDINSIEEVMHEDLVDLE